MALCLQCEILFMFFTTAYSDFPYFGGHYFMITREKQGDSVYSELKYVDLMCEDIQGSEFNSEHGDNECLCKDSTFILTEDPYCLTKQTLSNSSNHSRLIRFENEEHNVYLMKDDQPRTKVFSLVMDEPKEYLTQNKCGDLSVENISFALGSREDMHWGEFGSMIETVVKKNGQIALKVEIGEKMRRERLNGNLVNITLGSFKGICNGTLLMKFEGTFNTDTYYPENFDTVFSDYRVQRSKDAGDTIYCVENCENVCAAFEGSEKVGSQSCRCNRGTLLFQPRSYCLSEGADINATINDLGPHHPRLIRLNDNANDDYLVYTIDVSKEDETPFLMMFADFKGNRTLIKSECDVVFVSAVTLAWEVNDFPAHRIKTILGERGDYLLTVAIDDKKWLKGQLLNITISSYSGLCDGTVLIKIKGLYDNTASYDEDGNISESGDDKVPKSEKTDNKTNISDTATPVLIIACAIALVGFVMLMSAFILYRRVKQKERLYIRPPPLYPEPLNVVVGPRLSETENEYEYIETVRQNQPSALYVNRPDITIETNEDKQEPDIEKGPAFPRQNSAIPCDFYVNEAQIEAVKADADLHEIIKKLIEKETSTKQTILQMEQMPCIDEINQNSVERKRSSDYIHDYNNKPLLEET